MKLAKNADILPANKRYISTLLSVLCMGAGQLFNRQFVKGIFFFILHIITLNSLPFIYTNIRGLITLGETPMEDHSLFLMVYGVLTVFLVLIVIGIYILNIRDAYKNGLLHDMGREVPGFRESLKNFRDLGYAYFILTPGLVALLCFTILPLIYSVLIGFTNYDLYHLPPANLIDWVGFENFKEIFTITSWRKTFLSVGSWTVLWAILSTLTTYGLGCLLALILNNPRLKYRKIIRTILILPWAIPGFVSILVWQGALNTNFGIINQILGALFNMEPINWLTKTYLARIAVVLVNLWLGFPHAMIMITGILQGIPSDIYEAAIVDGVNAWQKFRYITLPLLWYSIAPLMIMSFAYNFNNFSLIYLLNGGGPPEFGKQGGAGGTDILISWVFKLTMDKNKYNYASAISLIIFFILAGFSIYNFYRSRSFQEEEMLK